MSLGISPAPGATVRYEALRTLRRRMVWVSLLPLCALILLLGDLPTGAYPGNAIAGVGELALLINFLGSVGMAVALADRMSSQLRPGLRELFCATPGISVVRTAGVVVGPWLIALAPFAAILLGVGLWLALDTGSGRPAMAAVTALVAIVIPGSLLLTVIANVLGLLLPLAAARILVVPLWYWATVLSPLVPVPTIARSVFSPAGDYPAAAWLSVPYPGHHDGWTHPAVSTATALIGLGIAIGVTALVLSIGHALLTTRREVGTEFG